ncbi:acetyl-CoA carboxylase biotin carboxylase subunit [Aliisedimentitalea scapharcae]|uniref:Acetyl-CoA carboxylase biotin carboxylase subunit n=1 Tax=Aliisedimentitalea scapharcae TaxID=1524259 RepID=A0ABZ2XVM9_9RHOB
MTPFTSLLVANRGEIACRIMRSARQMGLRCIAVHTDADADSPHVAMADQVVCIGEGPVGDSYLSIERLIAAARGAGAQAIHPGYGFLSENAGFARACADAGLIFVGPGADAIAVMGNKAAAKRKMIAAGVPCVPGYEGTDQSDAVLQQEADRIGFPVMIKAAAGGGGRGMRLVDVPAEFLSALHLARSEALSAFGSDEMILEKAVQTPRHVEVQVFADRQGKTIHLGERDCSVQRRHQKVVEEAPSPAVSPDLRARMGAAAVSAAQAVDYVGAGTVEFLLDADGAFYFLEMNTRLQVEHPVTEMVTGLDLVEMQLTVAMGRPVGLAQDDVQMQGHAIEVRLYAEDPAQDFMPQSGQISVWVPPVGTGLRVDDGICQGQQVSPYYDPMLAKIISHAPSREEARMRLIRGLQDMALFGVTCNRDFLIRVLDHPGFADGTATTGFLSEVPDVAATPEFDATEVAAAAAVMYQQRCDDAVHRAGRQPRELFGWSSTGALTHHSRMVIGAETYPVTAIQTPEALTVQVSGQAHDVTGANIGLNVDGQTAGIRFVFPERNMWHVATTSRLFTLRAEQAGVRDQETGQDGQILAPMHGNLQSVTVTAGQMVQPGTQLAILEAMKMQHEIVSPIAGVVSDVPVQAGDQVKSGTLLIAITPTG